MADLPPNDAPDAAEPAHTGDASTGPPPPRRPLPRAARLSRLSAPAAQAPAPAITPPTAAEAPVPTVDEPTVAEPTVLSAESTGLSPDPTVAEPTAAAAAPELSAESTVLSPEPTVAEPNVPAIAAAPVLSPLAPLPPASPPLAPLPGGSSLGTPAPVSPIPAQRPATAQSRPAEPIARPMVQLVELVAADAPTPSPAVAAAQQAAATAAARPYEPVVFKPLDEVMATRSVILSGIGIVLCFFPVLSLAGLLMGLLALRRIQRSNGALTGRGSARWGILLGAIGLVLGATADMVFLLRR